MNIKMYLVSLGVGILAGLLYGLLNVRSPAPPVVALIGLLGMLIGEQILPFSKQLMNLNSPASIEEITAPKEENNGAQAVDDKSSD